AASETHQDQLLRACYWLQHADHVYRDSLSAAFMSLVTAIEVLFEERQSTLCSSCEQRVFEGKGLRSLFAEFLQEFMPASIMMHRGGERKVADRLIGKLKKAMGY